MLRAIDSTLAVGSKQLSVRTGARFFGHCLSGQHPSLVIEVLVFY